MLLLCSRLAQRGCNFTGLKFWNMKKILGLDLGTNSIGWALVNEAENNQEKSSITKLGVRVISYDNYTNADGKEVKGNPADFFAAGKSVTPNAARTQARGMRRNLQRYKHRREFLKRILLEQNWITEESFLSEVGKHTTFQTLRLRAKSAVEEVSLEEFSRVLLNLNKKRGYKSSRKADGADGTVIDGMSVAKELYENNFTPGQLIYRRILDGRFSIPDFYRSDLKAEFDRVWEFQKSFYPELLTDVLKDVLVDKNKGKTWVECQKAWGIDGIKRDFRGKDLLKENYEWRAKSLVEKMDLEKLAVVFQEINGQIKNSSGYLGGVSDRSKELYFKGWTVGQFMLKQIESNPHHSLKNQVFFRQDYMDEFEKIWNTQAAYHPELTEGLKKMIRDVVIFYQRPLKSQKGLVSLCEFENREVEIEVDGKKKVKKVGLKAAPKSSPLFQEFKIWQRLNDLKVNGQYLDQDLKEQLFAELSIRGKMSDKDVLKSLFKNPKDLTLNFKEVEGNNTQSVLFKAYSRIIANCGYEEFDFSKMSASESLDIVSDIFGSLGYKTDFLIFDSSKVGKELEEQPLFRLWHLLYSYEGDKSISGNESLISKLMDMTGMDEEACKILAGVRFSSDYGSLSSKAMRKILEYMKEGNDYSLACEYAGYRHSAKSLTKEERENKVLKEAMSVLPKNSLRNPIVEKILNQMSNVVNEVIEEYGKPDEIRIEMARELKKSQKERKELSDAMAKTTKEHEQYRKILCEEFGISNPTRNDIVKYKLYLELSPNGFKTLYSDVKINPYELFDSNKYDIEHIIPKARLFDDSFSNKTIELKDVNRDKSDMTAYDYVAEKYGEERLAEYESRIEHLYKINAISRTKRNKLLMREADIPQGFIERDLRETQYIAKKAREMLEDVVKSVVSTTGSVTDRLREDWQLVDMMKELNWEKYDKLGMTEVCFDKDGRRIYKIKDWTKRNDHRHHAMDALTIAFTKQAFIQYLNNLNARINKGIEDSKWLDISEFDLSDIPKSQVAAAVRAIEKKMMRRDSKGRLRFVPPMPLDEFRAEAKKHMENILVSIKAKNKVVTRNVNMSKKKGGVNKKVQLTPRGQLHNETVYGRIRHAVFKEEKVGVSFGKDKIATVASAVYRKALMERLETYGGDPKKAFGGKNALDKNPVYTDQMHIDQVPLKVKTMAYEYIYTKREAVGPGLNIDKVIDEHVKSVLHARLTEYGGDPKKAFSNLDENPIWLNREKGICVKNVTITGKSNAVPLHAKRDKDGRIIKGAGGEYLPTDYVSTGSNHHVAIYRDVEGNLQEQVVSFLDAVTRVNLGIPVIDKDYKKEEGWEFLFTMKQNECFVFPNPETGFDPNDIDLLDPSNYSIISPNLFRVQKLATKNYFFRHHLETTVAEDKRLIKITYKPQLGLKGINGIVKVRINHLGQIIHVGE